MNEFTIHECKVAGCIYNRQGKCSLHGLKIVQFSSLILNHGSDICQAKEQLNAFKMENILSKKPGAK